ncbi:MAG: enoyl-CoA hydratase/isomerase family protein [Caldilineaceae bacterium]|nr:enoyl-CoA hydratase/isomerase family protein [Caldilineaceae bacterium]
MSNGNSGVEERPVVRTDAGGVTTLTLNRPRQFNAMSEEVLAALQAELDAIATDATVRVVVIAANGRAFSAGHDLKQMRANPRQEYYDALFATCSRMMLTVHRLPQPVIAKVQGLATAAGCQLVAACDLAIAADTAQFATSGIRVGLFCSTPAVPVSRNMGRKRALELLLTSSTPRPRPTGGSSTAPCPRTNWTRPCSNWRTTSSASPRPRWHRARPCSTASSSWGWRTRTPTPARSWRAT